MITGGKGVDGLRRMDLGIEFTVELGASGLLSVPEEVGYSEGKGVRGADGVNGVELYGVGPDDTGGILGKLFKGGRVLRFV